MKLTRFVHQWVNEKTKINIFTFPMIHIGTKEYYQNISNHINELNLILEEGVPIQIDKEIGSYKRLAAKLGLISQQEGLIIDQDMNRINIDLSKEEMENELRSLPQKELRKIKMAKYILPFISKESICMHFVKSFVYSDETRIKMVDPENHYSYKHTNSILDKFILNTRDKYIKENILSTLEVNWNREFRYDIGIMLGDEHMASIYKILNENGFKWSVIDEITAIEIERK
ncbi:MAG: hypothetical protein ACYDEX_25810, partial [Mobilitalea sp.]